MILCKQKLNNWRKKQRNFFSWENLKEIFHIENQKLLDMLNESEKQIEYLRKIINNNIPNDHIILDLQNKIQQSKTEILVIHY